MTPLDPSLAHPTAAELIDAVREHLATRVIPTITDPRLRFQTLVAAHVLGVVSREGALGDALSAALTEARAGLGDYPSDEALCEAIERGSFDTEPSRTKLGEYLAMRAEYALQSWNPAFLWRVKQDGADGTERPARGGA